MKNVTISMDEATLAWVRVEAAKAGQSVSRWVGRKLADAKVADAGNDVEETIRAIDEFLALPRVPMSENGKPFDRAEIYDERFRRFDHPDLSCGQDGPGEEGGLRKVAESARPFRGPDPKPSGSE
jgi:hypothetical protein